MNPYESPPSLPQPSEAGQTPPASRWAAVRSGTLQGTWTGAKWGMIVSGALAVLNGLAFVGIIAYRLLQEPNARLNMRVLATGMFGLVLFVLVSTLMTILAAAMLGAMIGGLWRGSTYRSAIAERSSERQQT